VAAHRFSCGALDTSEGAPSLPTGVLGDVDDPPFVALPLEDDDEACGETDGRAVAVDPDVEVERIGRAIDERVDLAQEGAPPLGGEDAEHPGEAPPLEGDPQREDRLLGRAEARAGEEGPVEAI